MEEYYKIGQDVIVDGCMLSVVEKVFHTKSGVYYGIGGSVVVSGDRAESVLITEYKKGSV